MLQSISEIIVVSKNCVPGRRVTEVKSAICGIPVNLTVGVRSLAGCEIKEYVLMFNDDRIHSMGRLSA